MKRCFSVIYVIAAFISLHLACGAADAPKILDINEDYWRGTGYTAYMKNGDKITDLSQLSLTTGDSLLIPLPAEAFLDSSGSAYIPRDNDAISTEQLREAGIDVKFRAEVGSQALEKIDFSDDIDSVFIAVDFVKEFAFTREIQFDYTLYLTVDGTKRPDTEIRLRGQIGNPVILVENEKYINISGGEVAEAQAYIKNIEVNLGNGVSVDNSFYEGSRYYGITKVKTYDGDTPLLEDYPEIVMIYTLRTIGLRQERTDIISFDLSDRYFVYDKYGNYLGTTDRKLPYSSTYYLSLSDIGSIEFPDY